MDEAICEAGWGRRLTAKCQPWKLIEQTVLVQSNHPQPFTQYNPEISQLVEKSVSCCFLLSLSAPEATFIISPFYHLKMRQINLSPTSTKFLEIVPKSSFPETCGRSEKSMQFWKALQRMDVGNWAWGLRLTWRPAQPLFAALVSTCFLKLPFR